MSEVWLPVKGYKGKYEVSSEGRVRSLDRFVRTGERFQRRIRGRILTPDFTTEYATVDLCSGGVRRGYLVHRLVACAFLDNPLNLPCVNHKDGNKTNNRADNLEFCTPSENMRHAVVNGLHRTTAVVREDGIVYKSISEAANANGLNTGHICECCRGRRANAGGYRWRYAEEAAQ